MSTIKWMIFACVAIIILFTHYQLFRFGQSYVISELQSQRVEILKDGKKIDESVLTDSDDGLLCRLLENCKSR